MLALIAPLAIGLGSQVPDFSGPIVDSKMVRQVGRRTVVVICWDPGRETDPAPSKESIEALVGGSGRSVAHWYRENSGGRFTIDPVVLGWFKSDKPGGRYWGVDTGDSDGDGFVDGHAMKWAEAVRKADALFDFRPFDKNKDGILNPTEIGVIVVIPQNVPFGTMRSPAGRELPQWEPLRADGLVIPLITEAYAGSPPNLGLFAHELSHLLLGAPDMYQDAPYRAGRYSLMDSSYGMEHIDPFEKLKLGWLKVRVVTRPGEHRLRSVESSSEGLVLYDPKRGPREYFIVENRWRKGTFDDGLPSDGLAVWHVIEDPALAGSTDWGRSCIRLLRANRGAPVDDSKALYGLDEACAPKWVDGTPSGFVVRMQTKPGLEVVVEIERKG